ncbi:Short-chain dehydrogenase/reductase family protein [Mycena kentingensis (nom. inval.)]|nr:Short-chain dehydrogenase/reductase family protein [Mycena kentingensis (nom. inval.)]
MASDFGFSTTSDEVAAALAEQIQGKNVLVTGTSQTGIGFNTAKSIAKFANLVIIVGYNAERLGKTEEAIKAEVPNANIRALRIDFSSLADVRRAAAEVNAYGEPLHVVIHNAAAPVTVTPPTADGFDRQFATNHVGPFLFTKLILGKLLAGKSAAYTPRVVYLSTNAVAIQAGLDVDGDFAAPRVPADAYDPFLVYRQTKAAAALMASELDVRAGGKVRAFHLHPGAIHTNIFHLADSVVVDTFKQWGMMDAEGHPQGNTWKTFEQGAATTLVAAFDPRLEENGGSYLEDCQIANDKPSPFYADKENGRKLWAATERLLGEEFTF